MKKSPTLLTIFLIIFMLVCFCVMCNQIGCSIRLIPMQSYGNTKILNPINVNTATEQELTLLPGIGENTANKIVSYRQEYGPFESISDLTNVPGIGSETLREISNYVTVGE